MIFDLFRDLMKIALIIGGLYFVFTLYVRHKQHSWLECLKKRRIAILLTLALIVSVIKLSEDILAGESGPFDMAILLFIHNHVSSMQTGLFEAVTLTGSSLFLFPLATAATIALLFVRRRFEALLLATSMISCEIVVYVVKAAVDRTRPKLWG